MKKILIRDKRLAAALQQERLLHRRYGQKMAKKLKLRMDALYAAESLADFWPPNSGSERCHELKGDSAGTFSMDLNQPYRLLFVARDVPTLPAEADERQRWLSITSIEIVEIKDTHG